MSDEVEVLDKKTGELINFRPTNPVEMEFLITELAELIEQLPEKLKQINEKRYEAERAYSRKKNTQLAAYCRQGISVTAARAQAEVDAMDELAEWHNWKAAFHYADDSLGALKAKLFGLLNVNKGVQAAYNTYGHGR